MSARIVIIMAFIAISRSGVVLANTAAPVLYREPADELVRRNSPVTLFCKAAGSPSPVIRWYRSENEKPLTNGAHRLLLPDGSLFFYRLRRRDAGIYYCTATNTHGTASSRHASVNIAYLQHDFRQSPKDIAVVEGKTVILECSPPKGHPPPVVAWRRDDDPLSLPTLRSRQEGSQLIIEDVRLDDGGLYSCAASNAAGARVSTPSLLVVLEVPRTERVLQQIRVLEGHNVTLPCRPRGRPKPQVAWLRLDGAMPGGRATVEGGGNLVLRDVRWEDEGVYACQLTSPAGTASANTSLHVVVPARFSKPPPANALLVPDRTRILPCIARGAPSPLVFWMRESSQNSENEWPLVMSGGHATTAHVTLSDHALHLTAGDGDAVWVCMAVNEIGGTFAPVHVLSVPESFSVSSPGFPESSWLGTLEEIPEENAEMSSEVALRKNATDAEILGLWNKSQVNMGEGNTGVVTLGEVQARRNLHYPKLWQERARSHAPNSAEVFWKEESVEEAPGVRTEGIFVLLCQRGHGHVTPRLLSNKTKISDLDFDNDDFVDFGRSYDEAYYSPTGANPFLDSPSFWDAPDLPEDPTEGASDRTPNLRTQELPRRVKHSRNRSSRRKSGWDFEWESRAAVETLPEVEEEVIREGLDVKEDQEAVWEGNDGSLPEEGGNAKEEPKEIEDGEEEENPLSSIASSRVRGRRHNVGQREEHRPSCRLSPFCIKDEVIAITSPISTPMNNPFGLPKGLFSSHGASESSLRESGTRIRNPRRPHTSRSEFPTHPHPLPLPPPPLAPRSLQERSSEYPETLTPVEDISDPEDDEDPSGNGAPRCAGLKVVARALAARGRHTLTGLQPFTTYWAVLVPFQGRVLGSPSNAVPFTTPQDVPAGWPDVTRWWADGGGSVFVVTLHWRPPPLRLQRGIVSAYRVVVAERGGSWRVLHNVTVPGYQRSVTVPAVTAPTVQITLWALTEAGAGPPSPPLALDLLTSSRIPQEALHESREDVWAWLLMLVAGVAFVLLIVVGVAMMTQRHVKRVPVQHREGSVREDNDDPKARLRLLKASGNSTSADYSIIDLDAPNKLMVSCSLSSPAASSHASSRSRLLRTPDCSSSTSQNTAIHRPTALAASSASSPQTIQTRGYAAPSEQEGELAPSARHNSWSSCDDRGCRFCMPNNGASAVRGLSPAGGIGGSVEIGAGKDRERSGLKPDVGANGHDCRCEFRFLQQRLMRQLVPEEEVIFGNIAVRPLSPTDVRETETMRGDRTPSDMSLTTVTPMSTLRRSSDEGPSASVFRIGQPNHPSPPVATMPPAKQRLFALSSTTTDFSNEDQIDRVFDDDPTTCSDTEASFFIPTRSPIRDPCFGKSSTAISDDFESWRFCLPSLKDRSSNLPDTLGASVLSRNVLSLNFDSAGNTLSDSDRHLSFEPLRTRPIYPSTFMEDHFPGCGGSGPLYTFWRRDEGRGSIEEEVESFEKDAGVRDPEMAIGLPSQGIRRTTSSFGGAALSKLLLRRKIKRQMRCRSDSSTSRESVEDPFDRTLQFVQSMRRQRSQDSQEEN
ncbi:uncharacterized protein LOC143018751 [Oratosquilla oratoria]|uniref:uncharacterized protein LOC143018751 n=1 Tax=Oratosquilla oratoria TaxID=337810 RepID=UPI003F76F004